MKCTGCVDSPEYLSGDSANVVYCHSQCQRAHWPAHKAQCNALRRRRKLLRAATMLKSALIAYRECVFDIDLRRIELKDGVLYLFQKQHQSTVRSYRTPFPNGLTTNNEHKEAALANSQCTAAMALLGPLTRKLLAGLASSIEVMDILIGKPLRRTKLVPGPDNKNCPHTVLKISGLNRDEDWVIDTAGCQYGFQEVLIPFEKYLIEKSCEVTRMPQLYDATETKDVDFFLTLPFLSQTKAQRENLQLEREARLHFAAFVARRLGEGGPELLDGSADNFQGQLASFLCGLKLHMMEVMEQVSPVLKK